MSARQPLTWISKITTSLLEQVPGTSTWYLSTRLDQRHHAPEILPWNSFSTISLLTPHFFDLILMLLHKNQLIITWYSVRLFAYIVTSRAHNNITVLKTTRIAQLKVSIAASKQSTTVANTYLYHPPVHHTENGTQRKATTSSTITSSQANLIP